MTLGVAFKEWAVVCRALAEGRQSVILRKGGIAEAGGAFTPEHSRFWLYPTHVHQQADGVRPEAAELLAGAMSAKPEEGTLVLSHFAEVAEIHSADDLGALRGLDDFHVWSADAVSKKFHYRKPGLYVLAVRVSAVPQAHNLAERPEYAGCKSWVDLGSELSTDGARPVIGQADWDRTLAEVRRQLAAGTG